MDQRGKTGHGRMPCVTIAAMGLSLASGVLEANPVTIPVRVTFVDPAAISQTSALESGSPEQNLGSSETVTVVEDNTVTDPAGGDDGSSDVTVIFK